MEDYIRELLGNKDLIEDLKKEPCYFSIITKVNYLIIENPETVIYKKDIFKCIRVLKRIKKRMFGDE